MLIQAGFVNLLQVHKHPSLKQHWTVGIVALCLFGPFAASEFIEICFRSPQQGLCPEFEWFVDHVLVPKKNQIFSPSILKHSWTSTVSLSTTKDLVHQLIQRTEATTANPRSIPVHPWDLTQSFERSEPFAALLTN